ncbi:hypothetical protein [Salinibacillus xinjiangensis]|nr:hypothetical protein [Salinibacillus xinjiangensis]
MLVILDVKNYGEPEQYSRLKWNRKLHPSQAVDGHEPSIGGSSVS